jgi:ubiquinone/menaquinone biosynthesis C-methylase UbiE
MSSSDKGPRPYATDYAAHDHAYKRIRSQGQKSWSTDTADNRARQTWIRAVLANHSTVQPRILFLGCGAGEFVIDASRAGGEAYGVDIAPTAIEMARAAASETGIACGFVVADVLALPFADQIMDIVVDDHCLHTIIGADRPSFLVEAKRVLKPEGIMLVRSMCSLPPRVDVDPSTRCLVVDGIAQRYFGTVDSLIAEVTNAGFRITAHSVHPDPDGADMLQIEAVLR